MRTAGPYNTVAQQRRNLKKRQAIHGIIPDN